MSQPLAKMAPTAVMIGMMGYCCWPYMGGSTEAPVEATSNLPEIGAVLLSPTIGPAPGRDPFGATSQAQMDVPEIDTVAEATVGPHGAAPRTGSNSAPGVSPVSSASSPAIPAPRTGSDSAPGAGVSGTAPAGKGSAPTKDKVNTLSGLVLNATYIHGDRRIAVINGQPYARGESLSVSNFLTEPYVVAEIQPYKVLLACQGESAELMFPDLASKATPPQQQPNKVVHPRPANSNPSVGAQSTPRTDTATQPDTSRPSQGVAESAAGREDEAHHE